MNPHRLRRGLPENRTVSPRPSEPSQAQARSSRKQDCVSKAGGDGETSWRGKERETPANSLHPSLHLSFSTVMRASEKWQPPRLPKSSLASRLLPLLGRPPSQALRGERCGVAVPAGQAKAMFPARLWGGDDAWPDLLMCLSSARMEARAQSKARGRGVGDGAGCQKASVLLLCSLSRGQSTVTLFCFQFTTRAHFTQINCVFSLRKQQL